MADLLDFGGVRVFTSNAAPGAGYVARFYDGGTTTPRTVYTDSTLGTAHGTSVTADAAGIFPAVWSSGGAVKCVIETAAGAVVQTIERVLSVSGSTSGAEDITFTPTVDLPFTNVQDAVEGAVAVAASGYAAFGVGITGNATLLANLDATGIGAGVYRFDNTTTGTFPTGVAAADTGMIELWRQAAATAMMELHHATTNRVFRRRLTASVWGAWREEINVNQATAQGDLPIRGASDFERLAVGAIGTVLTGGTQPFWAGQMIVVDQKASGTDGGTFTSGAWRTRTLNTVRTNSIGGVAALASNQITLPAGSYVVEASAPAMRVDSHQTRLQNITAGTTLDMGTSELTEQGGSIVTNRSFVFSKFTLAVDSVIELQHRCATTFATQGLGFAGSFGSEVYSVVKVTRIG